MPEQQNPKHFFYHRISLADAPTISCVSTNANMSDTECQLTLLLDYINHKHKVAYKHNDVVDELSPKVLSKIYQFCEQLTLGGIDLNESFYHYLQALTYHGSTNETINQMLNEVISSVNNIDTTLNINAINTIIETVIVMYTTEDAYDSVPQQRA